MAEPGIGEISDELKEKVLLNILKNKFHQDTCGESEAAPDSETNMSQRNELPHNIDAISGANSQAPPDYGDQTSTEFEVHPTSKSEIPTTTECEGHESAKSADHAPVDSENQIEAEPDREAPAESENAADRNQASTGSEDETPTIPEKVNSKTDQIKENEARLAADESNLSEAQLKERHEESQTLKTQANNFYKESAFSDAATKYSAALDICPLREEKDRAVLHANRAAALMAAHQNKEALPDLDRALELDSNYLKALERRARLNRQLENLDDSLKDYERLLELKPKHYAYIAAIRELREQIKTRDEELKTKMMDSLKQLGNVFLKPFGLSTENFSMVPNEGGGYNLQMKGQQ